MSLMRSARINSRFVSHPHAREGLKRRSGTYCLRNLRFADAMLAIAWLTASVFAQEPDAPKAPRIKASDSVSYVYGPMYQTLFIVSPSSPGGANIARNSIEWMHHDQWRYGSNLLDLSLRKSSNIEPAAEGLKPTRCAASSPICNVDSVTMSTPSTHSTLASIRRRTLPRISARVCFTGA